MRFRWDVGDPLPGVLGCARALEVCAGLCFVVCDIGAPLLLTVCEEVDARLPEAVCTAVHLLIVVLGGACATRVDHLPKDLFSTTMSRLCVLPSTSARPTYLAYHRDFEERLDTAHQVRGDSTHCLIPGTWYEHAAGNYKETKNRCSSSLKGTFFSGASRRRRQYSPVLCSAVQYWLTVVVRLLVEGVE